MVQPKSVVLVSSLVLLLTSAFQFTSNRRNVFKNVYNLRASSAQGSVKEEVADVKKFRQRVVSLGTLDDEPPAKTSTVATFADIVMEAEVAPSPYRINKEEEVKLMMAAGDICAQREQKQIFVRASSITRLFPQMFLRWITITTQAAG